MMRDELKIPLSMLRISFLDKLKFKGSYKGKRFMFEKVKNEDGTSTLRVYIWKDLFNFENTDEKDIIRQDFEYTKGGIEEGLTFVEETNI